ncbi:MAG TPA: tRNA 2-thiouridine(34) synthase MnmA [bacterium]
MSDVEKIRVAVAMSGGVDSSVAAALLVKQGYQVVGLTMKLYNHEGAGIARDTIRGCCSLDAILRAQAVCHTLGIPHYSIDLVDEFEHYVIEDFISEYISGRTPNPCVRCNTYIKWGALFEKARQLGCDKIATGHYARIQNGNGEYQLWRAADPKKDQAYALWGIPRERLENTLLPLGELAKPQVREIASELGQKTAQTPDSQEICFVPDGDYGEFLIGRAPILEETGLGGELVEETGEGRRPVGSHAGYPFYTVGQRKGLGGGFPEARYVLRTEPATNRVVIGKRERLLGSAFRVDQVNWLTDSPLHAISAQIQIRYHSPAVSGRISPCNDGADIHLNEPVEAITPGQSAAFFDGNRLIGGGRIIEVNTSPVN